jgi:RNA polymerase sigma-70 factor (ECF subfamily)
MEPFLEDDPDAIQRMKAGDIGGLEPLVRRYQLKAVRAALLILRDRQTAEDVTQETFLRIFQHIRTFDERRPFAPYLFRCVVNAALDAARTGSIREQTANALESVEDLLNNIPSVEDQVEFDALRRKVQAALERLSARQRAVVVMRYYLEMNEHEIAETLNSPVGTVKWLLHKARLNLRNLLGAERRRR